MQNGLMQNVSFYKNGDCLPIQQHGESGWKFSFLVDNWKSEVCQLFFLLLVLSEQSEILTFTWYNCPVISLPKCVWVNNY